MNIKTVTVIGANGTMGKNVSAIFASFGNAKVYLACRTMEKAKQAIVDAYKSIRTETIREKLIPITYDNIESAIKESDLIFETLNEDIDLKISMYEKINDFIQDNSIIGSVTSGLSIKKLSSVFGSKKKNFFGIHFFNPPYNLSLCELVIHDETQREKALELSDYLTNSLNRTVVLTKDLPSFLGNRIGFFFINEALKLAEEYNDKGGIDYIDAILGNFTGRSMPPIVTADFVGLDTSKSIIDYIFENIDDSFRNSFELPNYITKLVGDGRLGRKVGLGLYKKEEDKKYVYDIENDEYRLVVKYNIKFANEMKENIIIGKYKEAINILLSDSSNESTICRQMIYKYIIYSLYVSNVVTDDIYSCDDAMATGFGWLPPIGYIELLGGKDKFYELVKKEMDDKWIKVLDNERLLDKLNKKSKYDYRKFIKS